MARSGEYDGEMELSIGTPPPSPVPRPLLKTVPTSKEPDVPIPDAPIVLDATHEAREQPAAQMGFLG